MFCLGCTPFTLDGMWAPCPNIWSGLVYLGDFRHPKSDDDDDDYLSVCFHHLSWLPEIMFLLTDFPVLFFLANDDYDGVAFLCVFNLCFFAPPGFPTTHAGRKSE